MKILITGHNGFIGKNMVLALKRDHELAFYDWGDPDPEIKGLDWVIHLGAISSTVETDVERVLAQNLDFSIWLHKQCCKHNVNLQWASSASVYGPNNTTFSEQDPADPRSPYAWSKYLFERYLKSNSCSNIHVQGFRYFNVYGPHEDHKGNQASPQHKFSLQSKNQGKITLFEGSENFCRDFVPVGYVCEIHQIFFDIPASGVWNVGTGTATSFLDVAKKYNVPIEFVPMPEHIAKHYQKYTCANITKLEKYLCRKY
jgi:ADP-L-glycero-D-manno-heptose 6-epimerase